jgi:hypothetical protein
VVVLTSFLMCWCDCVWVCNVWVCVCVRFVVRECFDGCVGVLVICVLVFTVFYIVCIVSFMYIHYNLLCVY